MRRHVETYADRLRMRADEKLAERVYHVERLVTRMQTVMSLVRLTLMQTVQTVEHAGATIGARIESRRQQVEALVRLVRELDPSRVLRRGYALVKKGGVLVKSAGALDKGDRISVHLAEGQAEATIV